MIPRHGRAAFIGTALALVVFTGGCARDRSHEGFVMDQTLVNGVQPGVDNRASVEQTLGRPTFTGQFTQQDWYYVSRDLQRFAFGMPKPDRETVLHIRFDDKGNVATVERTGLEKVASIQPMHDKTPTLGRSHSFFEEIFSNIGQVGSVPTGPGGGASHP